MDSLEMQIHTAAELICQSTQAIAFTGAGISTPSGIPDFRSQASDLWNSASPMDVASIRAFRQNPENFYAWVRPLANKALQAKPNAAHVALAELEAVGKLKAIITQNIDGLHQASNSKAVFEVHGHSREMTCLQCFKTHDARPIFEQFLIDNQVPHCDCGGIWKPNVILFGEQFPIEALHQAKASVATTDLLLAAGSSLEVAPISDLLQQALAQQVKIIVINYQETPVDSQATLVIRHNLIDILPEITKLVVAQNQVLMK